MNNSYIMSESLEARQKRTRALMITAGFAAIMTVLLVVIKWDIPKFEKEILPTEVEIALNLPEEAPPPPEQALGGGGGGGNPVEAPNPPGQAPPTPPTTGEKDESDDAEVSENNNTPIPKPTTPKKDVKEIVKTGPVKPVEKPVETPVPPKPKNVYRGATDHGTSTGGNNATTYERAGGQRGGGTGVGNGPGYGGGTGGGTGGGNGTGPGTGTGPSRISGSRTIINPKPMNVEDDLKGKIRAEIKVSPDGVGKFVRAVAGSLMNNASAKEVVRDWLRRNKFNKGSEETTEVYEFVINY